MLGVCDYGQFSVHYTFPLIWSYSFFVFVGKLANLTSNFIQEIESINIPEAIFITIFELAEYANM
jgi:hypothetical protein